jgi:CelD/BcsL family acetyltransferase involved in cellulose biosynthesis
MDSAIRMREPRARDDRARDGRRDAGVHVALLTSPEEWGAAGLRAEWEAVLGSGGSRLALFQAPEWFDHLSATEPAAQPALACLREGSGRLIGVLPLVRTRFDLEYTLKHFRLGKSSLSLLEVPGGAPLWPEDVVVYDRLFERLGQAARGHDGLCLRFLPTSSFCWRYLHESPLIRAGFSLCLPEPPGWNHGVELPPTFEAYLAHFKSRTRYNLRQRVKQLRQHGGGELSLRRFETPGEAPAFLESAAPVARRSWQARYTEDRVDTTPFWRRKVTDLAERGLLRAYVLTAGSEACAFVFGYQGRGTFHHVQIGYDPAFADASPGSVLHYLLFEDLIGHRPPRRVSFGHGDSEYKRTFGTVGFEEATVFLVNHRWTSRWKLGSYTAFKSLVRRAKTWVRRGAPPAAAPEPSAGK